MVFLLKDPVVNVSFLYALLLSLGVVCQHTSGYMFVLLGEKQQLKNPNSSRTTAPSSSACDDLTDQPPYNL
jgi:hypothetical protein